MKIGRLILNNQWEQEVHRECPQTFRWVAAWNGQSCPADDRGSTGCLAGQSQGERSLVEVGVWHGVATFRTLSSMAHDAILYAADT
jgi:hypothetical protein